METHLSYRAMLPDSLIRSPQEYPDRGRKGRREIRPESPELGLPQDFISNAGPILSSGAWDWGRHFASWECSSLDPG